jgi:hypothetical protein
LPLAGLTETGLYCVFCNGFCDMTPNDEFDPLAPQREAAFFYGLFLRGHSVDALRQDIDVSPKLREKWQKAKDFRTEFRADLERIYAFRKQVLAVFEALVQSESINARHRTRLQ